ncbi:unnamed protein product [Prunus armeniaca]
MSNYVKINFDGAWKKDSHFAGLGVVARDAIGSFCGGLATPFHCNLALVAEAAAGVCAFKFALNHNFTDIILETDLKILVEGVRGGGKNGVWAIQSLLDEFKKFSVCFRSVLRSWVPRILNRAAHKAAAIGIRAKQLESWAVRPPPFLVGVLLSDGLPCPPGRNEDETSLLLPIPSRSAVSAARKLPPASVLGNHEVLFRFLVYCSINNSSLAAAENTTIPINVGVVLDLETRLGKMGMSCIDMALSDFYSSHGYYSTRLILHTRDSMSDVVVAAAAALDLINNVEVQAIIGLESSMQASFVISLGDKAQVPIISFTATSPSLGGSYLFRIAQNDSSQAEAISTIIQAFGWSEAVLITIDSEFGLGVTPYLTTALHAVGVRIPYWSVISPMATDDQILVELYKLMKMQTRVFIVHILPSLGFRFFAKAKEVGMMDEGYVWIVTSGMANVFSSSNFSVIDNMQGVLGLKTYVPNTKELENFRARWQRKFQQDNPTIPDDKLNVFGLWAYDAAWALAMAVEKVAGTNFSFQKMNISPNSTYLGRLEVSQSGPQLAREISRTRFKGLSGDFSLIKGQLQSSTFQVINMNDNGERGVGFWTPQNGLVRKLNWNNTSTYSTSNANLGPIIWPGETMSTPKGWDIPAGSNLRVLVPVKMLFKEFVNVTYGPSSHTTTVAGYCIEVFEAVMKTLPYAVSYQFIPFATPNGESAGTYDELVNQVFLGKYDVAVGDISIRANRALYVDFTLPYTESGMSMIVPIKDNNNPRNTWVFLKPLTWDLWVTSGCFFHIHWFCGLGS